MVIKEPLFGKLVRKKAKEATGNSAAAIRPASMNRQRANCQWGKSRCGQVAGFFAFFPSIVIPDRVALPRAQVAWNLVHNRNAGHMRRPDHWVELAWSGPQAARMDRGPFHSSPGAGLGNNDCHSEAESIRDGSNCTPQGAFSVEAFSYGKTGVTVDGAWSRRGSD
jgi:hypothetical protein